jgi:hypothetical protein
MKNVTFPRTYTTLGAIYRAKKTFSERFPTKTFVVIKQDGKYTLECINETQQVVVEYVGNEII